MGIDYAQLRTDVEAIIDDLGDSLVATITHLDGTTSRGKIVFSNASAIDVSIPDVGTVQGTTRTAFINDIRKVICVGDKVTANSITYRVRESVNYKPATINVGYKVVLDT